jgi:hypothetical protein
VAQLCRRLDGLPLAIELAAARIGVMTPAELAGRLDRRFATLAGGRRHAVQRHQTLRAAIDWSYQLCSDAERRLLARLAVFTGGCTDEAAEAICGAHPLSEGEVFELLAGLVAKSLVVAQRDGSSTRYRLLETIREYGEDRLADWDETDPVRHRHAEYYCQLVGVLANQLDGREQLDAARRLLAERDNLMAAVNFAIDTADTDLALRLVVHGLDPFAYLGFAVYPPVDAVLELPAAISQDLYPHVLALSAYLSGSHGRLDQVEHTCQEALDAARLLSSERQRRRVHWVVTSARIGWATALGRWREAADYGEQAARIALEDGQGASAARGLASAANSYILAGDPDAGLAQAEEGLQLARAADAPMTVAFCLVALAGALAHSEPRRARGLLEEALALREGLDIESVAEVTQATLIAASMGDWPLTLQLADRSVRHLQWGEERSWFAGVLNVVARALADSDIEAAARLHGAARHLAHQSATGAAVSGRVTPTSAPPGPGLITDFRHQTSELLHDAIDDGRLRQLRAEGEAMDSDQAAAYALEAIRRARQSTAP